MEGFLERWVFNPTMERILGAVIGLLIIIYVIRLLQRSLTRYIKDPDIRYRARKFIGFVGYFAGVLLLAVIFSDRLGRFSVALGVAGAGIAFALQEVIASIAGWVAVSFGHFYRPGDRIQLGGIVGDVIDIGFLRTTMMECGGWVRGDQYNGRIVRLANSSVFKDPVFNYSADFPFLWDEIVVPVKYGSDMNRARDILLRITNEMVGEYAIGARVAWEEIVKKYKIEHAKVEPTVSLTANENWMEFTIRYVVDYKERRLKKDRIFNRLLEEFDKTDGRVTIASTSTDIHLVETPAMDVRLGKKE
ncbi:MAG: mechanosensitive ion channel family protein [Desulfobacteraceae bacterium]|jgi:small-conductance mechanosensitive channel